VKTQKSFVKTNSFSLAVAALLCVGFTANLAAQGTAFTYQGVLNENGSAANGNYDLRFELFTASVGGLPTVTVTNLNVAVANGQFTTPVDFGPGVFTGTIYWLQLAARTNGGGAFTTLSPRQELTPTPYALYSASAPVADNSVTSAKIVNGAVGNADLADNSVTSAKILNGEVMNVDLGTDAVTTDKILNGTILGADLANNTVGSAQLADNISIGDSVVNGQLHVYNTASGAAAISLYGTGTGGYLYLRQDDGQTGIYLDGDSGGGGLQYLYAADGSTGIMLDGESGGAGLINIYNTNGSSRISLDGSGSGSGGQIGVYAQDGSSTVQLYGESGGAGLINVNNNVSSTRVAIDGEGNGLGGQINLYAGDGGNGITLYGDSGGAGYLAVYNTNSSSRVTLDGFSSNGGGEISVYDANGTESIELLGAYGSTFGGIIRVKQGDGSVGVEVFSESYAGDGGLISIKNAAGTEKIELDGDDGDGSPAIRLRNAAGTTTITLDGDVSGDGRITTQELQITGGSDLSEQFDINPVSSAIQPGMVVSIDPQRPGELVMTTRAYDRTVAGVVSGAGGVKPGMLMGQHGTKADGKHPVALTGRVFCLADAANGAIQPGDLLTTSSTPGHAMRVTNHNKAQGAILGKAMTSLEAGQGLVLVLVSLQ